MNPSNVRERHKHVISRLEPKTYIMIIDLVLISKTFNNLMLQGRIDVERSNNDKNTRTLFAKTRWIKLLITN